MSQNSSYADFDLLEQVKKLQIKAVYLSNDTAIKVVTMNSNASLTAILFHARIAYFNGEIDDIELRLPVTTSDRSQETSTILSLKNCYLVSCQVDPVQNTRYGQCYAQVVVNNIKKNIDVCMLLAGYLESVHSLATGLSDISEKQVKSGYLRVVAGTDPAAGSEILETVPTNARWDLVSIRMQLVTSAAVANRQPRLFLDDGTNEFWRAAVTGNITASLTTQITAGRGLVREAISTTVISIALPNDTELLQGWRIGTSTVAMDAGDNYAVPIMYVKERIEE